MSDFDAYFQWLDIPPDEQPPTPHRLLGIASDETNKEIIREATLQRNAFIRQFSLGEQGQIAEQLLNEIAAARDNIITGNVQTAVETPSAVETPIEPVDRNSEPSPTEMSADAQFKLGVIHHNGTGVAQDNIKAMFWYRLAAERGHAIAQTRLGVIYDNGEGDTQDYTEARKWYRLAAEQGNAIAQSYLGLMYEFGQGVPEDDKEAIKWYRLAGVVEKKAIPWFSVLAERGHASARTKLGVMYDNGDGVAQDYTEAVKWYRLAAEQGHASAQTKLGVMYEYGRGVPEDTKEAMKWHRLAGVTGQQGIWKRPVVIGISVVGVIGVLILFISLMFSGNADPVVSNSADRISAEMVSKKAAADKATADKNAAVTAALGKGDWKAVLSLYPNNSEGLRMKAAAEKAAAEKAAAEKAAAVTAALGKGDWKTVLSLDPDNSDGLRMQTAAEKAAVEKAAVEKAAAVNAFLGNGDWKAVLSLDPENSEGLRMKAAAELLALPPITNTIGMTLKLIPAGTFLMGTPEGETDRRYNEDHHRVTITTDCYMQTTEVTQAQWKTVMDSEPWKGTNYVKEGPDYPATQVSWDDAIAFSKKISEKEGKTYRLPTEAEWEYACRAGTKTPWNFAGVFLGQYAWYDKNTLEAGEQYAHHVELKKPNAFGLYDMHGNVWEWCHDYYGEDYYKQSLEKDPQGPVKGSFRVLRGGSWDTDARVTRSGYRGWRDAGTRLFNVGFRLVRELD